MRVKGWPSDVTEKKVEGQHLKSNWHVFVNGEERIVEGKMGMMKENVIDTVVFLLLAAFYIAEAVVQLLLPVRYRTKNVSGEVVLITGGGGGLGRLLAERFSKLGCTVVVWDINREAIEETVEAVKAKGGDAYGYVCDITKRELVYRAAKEVQQDVGKVSILVNNAGIVSGKPLLETPDHMIQRTFDVNVISHFWTTKAFLPGMIDSKKGHIVTVASMAGIVGMTKLVDYCASKFAALGFDESLRLELESHGYRNIHTTAICPYFIKSTGMFDGVRTSMVPVLEASYVADKIVQAVITNQKQVYIPGFFKALIWLKGIMPWAVVSMFLKALVHDAHPDHIINRHFVSENVEDLNGFCKSAPSILECTTNGIPRAGRDCSSERKP